MKKYYNYLTVIVIIAIAAFFFVAALGCGMTPAQKNAVNELDKNADYFIKYIRPTAKQPIKDVIDANKALTQELLKETK